MKTFKEFLSESEQCVTLVVPKEDKKVAEKILKSSGLTFGPSKAKISEQVAYDVKGTEKEVEFIQSELAEKDINSWLEGKKNKKNNENI